jgi:hypothetical protein
MLLFITDLFLMTLNFIYYRVVLLKGFLVKINEIHVSERSILVML